MIFQKNLFVRIIVITKYFKNEEIPKMEIIVINNIMV